MSFFVECPHCKCQVEILQINCAIFRHGVFKDTKEQIHPHLPKEQCDALIQEDKIYGCGKPFQLIKNGEKYEATICDYI